MGPLTAQRLETIRTWKPPAGVTWSIQYQAQTGTIALAMRSGDFCDIHFVLGEGEKERLIAVKAAEALRDRWLAELVAPRPEWLEHARAALSYLATTPGICGRTLDKAALILASIEAEEVSGPSVLTAMKAGGVRVGWRRGNKSVSIEVQDLHTIEITQWTTEALISRETHRSGFFEAARSAISWLYPEANTAYSGELL